MRKRNRVKKRRTRIKPRRVNYVKHENVCESLKR